MVPGEIPKDYYTPLKSKWALSMSLSGTRPTALGEALVGGGIEKKKKNRTHGLRQQCSDCRGQGVGGSGRRYMGDR